VWQIAERGCAVAIGGGTPKLRILIKLATNFPAFRQTLLALPTISTTFFTKSGNSQIPVVQFNSRLYKVPMRISSVRIQNFRSLKDETIQVDDYTCLVGANGSGKSTILTALNIFFRETADAKTDLLMLAKEDFHGQDTNQDIRITVTFTELSAEAQVDFKAYYRQNQLVITALAKWDPESETAKVLQHGERLGIDAFRIYFEREKAGALAPELKASYTELRADFPELPASATKSKAAMLEAMLQYETDHADQCNLILSPDQFYGVSKGANRLQKYVQWVYIPAVKDVTTEQTETKSSALGKLLERRVRSQISLEEPIDQLKQDALEKYHGILDVNTQALNVVAESLSLRMQVWAHRSASLKLNWHKSEKAVIINAPIAQVRAVEGTFEGELARFGHGFHRSFLFSLLQELAEQGNTGPRLLLGCEEPELYQHPPQAKYLASVFQKLTNQNTQIFVCTHSPHFVSGQTFESIRMCIKDFSTGVVTVQRATFEEVATLIAKATGKQPKKTAGMAAKIEQDMFGPMSEMFFATVRVFVEGLEDVAFISSYLTLLGKWDEFRSLGCHLVQVQGKSNLITGIAIAKQMRLSNYVVFDSDGDTPADTEDKKTGNRARHERDNLAILALVEVPTPIAFPQSTFWFKGLTSWQNSIADVVKNEIGLENYKKLREDTKTKYDMVESNLEKNSLFIGYLMAEAWAQGKKSPTLVKLCEEILTFAKSGTISTIQAAAAEA
jgi:putative ATP-dependent endonuclease of the OLD family